ncbi:TIGR00270 family protein [Candidatus Micrarchaeota archaeon]|nr:TIGR00270 family protein [Candidatus Micrarchaeota archaeon]
MSSCDICGRPGSLQALVEGAKVNVCNACSPFGKVTNRQAIATSAKGISQRETYLVDGFGKIIQNSREKAGYGRQELAQKLNMREADLRHFEEEKVKPSEADARKLQTMLKINLFATLQEQHGETHKKPNALTLADVVVIKDKRK